MPSFPVVPTPAAPPAARRRHLLLRCGAVLALLGACTADAPTTPAAPAPATLAAPSLSAAAAGSAIPDQYIVVFKRDVADPVGLAGGIARANGGTVLHTYQRAIKGFAVRLPARAAEALRRNPNVAYVEEDATVTLDATTQSGATWGIDRIDQHDLPLSRTYSYGPTGAGVTVYVIDTGIRFSHQEFGGRASPGVDLVPEPDNTAGVDCDGHGTHVAGTVGGATYGAAKGASLVAVRVFGCTGNAPWSRVIAAVEWVTEHHAPLAVANMSLSGGRSQALDDAVAGSIHRGVVYAVSAGNDYARDACSKSPAAVPAAITVASSALRLVSSTLTDTRSDFSNVGTCVDLFAPGSNVTSAWRENDTQTNMISGTSMAAPHVAGAAALYREAYPDAAPAQVAAALVAHATPGKVYNPGTGTPDLLLYTGFLTEPSANTAPVADAGGPYAAREATPVALTWSASDADGDALEYAWDFGNGVTGRGAALPAAYTYPDNPAAPATAYTMTLTASDGKGGTSTQTTTATVANVAPTGTFTVSPSGGRVVVGHAVTLGFTGVTDFATADVAAGISQGFACNGDAYTTATTCAAPNAGALTVAGVLTDKDGGATAYGPLAVTVDPATPGVTVANASGQYSDRVTLSASLATNAGPDVAGGPTGTMEFFVNGAPVGTAPVTGTGAVTTTVALTQSAGSHPLTARFTSTAPNYASSAAPSSPATLAVAAEGATLAYAATNPAAVRVASAGGTSGSFTLQVGVAESQPDGPSGAALAGDVNRAAVAMTLAPVGPGGPVTASSCMGTTAPSGYSTNVYTCSFAGVPVNTYAVQVSATGGYYAGGTEDVLTVYDPSLGFASGGGSIAWPGTGERTTFGFTLRHNKSGTSPTGSLVVVRHLADGTVYRLKSNALGALALSPAGSASGYATFSGKGTYLQPGWTDPQGNYAWTAYVEDNDQPGAGQDKLWLRVTNGVGLAMGGPAATNARTLTGGNVVVPHGGR